MRKRTRERGRERQMERAIEREWQSEWEKGWEGGRHFILPLPVQKHPFPSALERVSQSPQLHTSRTIWPLQHASPQRYMRIEMTRLQTLINAHIIPNEKMRKRKPTHKSTVNNFTEQTPQNGFLVMCKFKCKNWTFQAEQQVHKQHHATTQQKKGETAYITITLIITLGNPIKINSSMEGVPNTHTSSYTHRNTVITH